jgi:hypothetical protein
MADIMNLTVASNTNLNNLSCPLVGNKQQQVDNCW